MGKHTFWLTLFIAACVSSFVMSIFLFVYPAPAMPLVPRFLQDTDGEQPPVGRVEEIKLLFFGDIMLDRNVKAKIKAGGLEYIFQNFALPVGWEQTDMQMANLEGAVTAGGEHYPPSAGIDFAFDPADVALLKNYGFNAFTLANNHMLDQGTRGYEETKQHLDEIGFNYVGCPDRQVSECSVATTTVQGLNIGLAGYSMVYGLLDEEKMAEQVRALAEETDLVIATAHWGVEYVHQHNQTQERVAHALVDASADIVIGHHPHVVQDVEVYKGVPIFYSLGNFIFDQYFSKETQEGMGVGIVLRNNEGHVAIERIELLPHYGTRSQVQLMEGDQKERFLVWLSEISILEDIKDGVIRLGQ